MAVIIFFLFLTAVILAPLAFTLCFGRLTRKYRLDLDDEYHETYRGVHKWWAKAFLTSICAFLIVLGLSGGWMATQVKNPAPQFLIYASWALTFLLAAAMTPLFLVKSRRMHKRLGWATAAICCGLILNGFLTLFIMM